MAKVMISLPDDLLAVIDARAEEQGSSRSRLVRDALRLYVAQGLAADRRGAIRRLRRTFRSADFDPEGVERAERTR